MDYYESVNYTKRIIENLKLPLELIEEVMEIYTNFGKENKKFVGCYTQEDIIKCVILSVARKNGYYVMINEILQQEPNGDDIYLLEHKNKRIRGVYKQLKTFLGTPNYMNYNSENYINRIGQLLKLQQEDLDVVFKHISSGENILSILAKFNKYLDIEFEELVKIRPNLSVKYLKDNYP